MGTELEARGVSTALPRWSASALIDAPEVVAAIHAEYAAAGATVHTTNTFRTRAATMGEHWQAHAQVAVDLARQSVPPDHRVAGSVAPLMDCYRPELSPGQRARREHQELVTVLADAGCDLILCETHSHPEELRAAVAASATTGLPVWASLTAGPEAALLSPTRMRELAEIAVGEGAECVLVNCTPAAATLAFVTALANQVPRVGAYANAGSADDVIGWCSDHSLSTQTYTDHARRWIDAGASVLGGCCGTRPSHIAALARLIQEPPK